MATNQDTPTDTDESTTDQDETDDSDLLPEDVDETGLQLRYITARQLRDAREADGCGALGCRRTDSLRPVVTNAGERVLCRYHAKHVMGVSS